MEENRIIAYKGFDKDLCCQDFQYEVGGEYEYLDKIRCRTSGFHACINPLDVLVFYSAYGGNMFCKVEQYGDIDVHNGSCATEQASSKILIKEEIGIWGLCNEALALLTDMERMVSLSRYSKSGKMNILSQTDQIVTSAEDKDVLLSEFPGATITSSGWGVNIGSTGMFATISSTGCGSIGSTGDDAKIYSRGSFAGVVSSGTCATITSNGQYAVICSMGERSSITSTGDRTTILSSGDNSSIHSRGYQSRVESTGEKSVITCLGDDSMVKARKGSWITLSEWREDNMIPTNVRTKYVDDDRIKADTWYKLIDGKFCVVEQ